MSPFIYDLRRRAERDKSERLLFWLNRALLAAAACALAWSAYAERWL